MFVVSDLLEGHVLPEAISFWGVNPFFWGVNPFFWGVICRPSQGLLCSSNSKEPACNAGDQCSIPGLGGSSGEGNGNPLQYYCLENSPGIGEFHGQRSLVGYSLWGRRVGLSQTQSTEQLTHTHRPSRWFTVILLVSPYQTVCSWGWEVFHLSILSPLPRTTFQCLCLK